jgi:transposase
VAHAAHPRGARAARADLYEPQLDSIRASRIKAMDETPIKAGRAGPGKMKGGYFWPVYGERDEICFAYHEGRSGKERYAQKCGLTRAQCWAHSRRKFFEAHSVEPERAAQALEMIGQLYAVEQHIREVQLVGEARRAHRLAQAKPMADRFFDWVDAQFESHGLLPSSPLTTALAYVRERRAALEVYLADPEVPIDTNHLERALRVVPMGRRNWLFCWTEVGAKYVGIAQSLIATCRLHDIDPYTYLVGLGVQDNSANNYAGQGGGFEATATTKRVRFLHLRSTGRCAAGAAIGGAQPEGF